MSNESNASFVVFNPATLQPCGILQVLIASAGILGNVWILTATVTSKVLRSNTNILIALLALADLLACSGSLIVSTTTAFDVAIVFFRTASSTFWSCITTLRSDNAATLTYQSQRFAM